MAFTTAERGRDAAIMKNEPPRAKSSGDIDGGEDGVIVHSVSSMAIASHDDAASHLQKARDRLKLERVRDGWMHEPAHFASAYVMEALGGSDLRCAAVDTTLSALLGLNRAAEFASHCQLSNVTDTPIKLAWLLNSREARCDGHELAALVQRKMLDSPALCVFVHGYAASKEVWATHMPLFLQSASESGRSHVGIALSLFGSEGTCPNARPRKLHEAACQASDVLLKLGLEQKRLLLIGHSMGGNVVLRMLLQAPIMLHMQSSELCALSLTPVVSSDPSFLLSLHDSVGQLLRSLLLRLGLLVYVKDNARMIDFFNRIYHVLYLSYHAPSASQQRRLRLARGAALLCLVLLLSRGFRAPKLHMRHPTLSTARWLAIVLCAAFSSQHSLALATLPSVHNVPAQILRNHGAHFGAHAGNYLSAITEGILGQTSVLTDREIAQLARHANRIRVVVASDDKLVNSWCVVEKLQNSLPLLFCRGSHYVQCGPDLPRILEAVKQLAASLS